MVEVLPFQQNGGRIEKGSKNLAGVEKTAMKGVGVGSGPRDKP